MIKIIGAIVGVVVVIGLAVFAIVKKLSKRKCHEASITSCIKCDVKKCDKRVASIIRVDDDVCQDRGDLCINCLDKICKDRVYPYNENGQSCNDNGEGCKECLATDCELREFPFDVDTKQYEMSDEEYNALHVNNDICPEAGELCRECGNRECQERVYASEQKTKVFKYDEYKSCLFVKSEAKVDAIIKEVSDNKVEPEIAAAELVKEIEVAKIDMTTNVYSDFIINLSKMPTTIENSVKHVKSGKITKVLSQPIERIDKKVIVHEKIHKKLDIRKPGIVSRNGRNIGVMKRSANYAGEMASSISVPLTMPQKIVSANTDEADIHIEEENLVVDIDDIMEDTLSLSNYEIINYFKSVYAVTDIAQDILEKNEQYVCIRGIDNKFKLTRKNIDTLVSKMDKFIILDRTRVANTILVERRGDAGGYAMTYEETYDAANGLTVDSLSALLESYFRGDDMTTMRIQGEVESVGTIKFKVHKDGVFVAIAAVRESMSQTKSRRMIISICSN